MFLILEETNVKTRTRNLAFLDSLSLPILIMLALTLGLAPFVPEPHLFEKIRMLTNGQLTKPIDIFDFLLHATPWVVLMAKLARMAVLR